MKVLPNFPYFSQINNCRNPYGSCNVTSVAMSLWHLGIRGDRSEAQLEDQMYSRCELRGWDRHDPIGLKKLVESYPGCKDAFTDRGTFAMLRQAIDVGSPVVLHGYFTRSGHIIAVKGYDDTGLIVNDPYGEWFAMGYDTRRSGEALHYSYGMIARLCSPESTNNPQHLWIHRISRSV
jgi:uncharacterized protein YvpB